MRLVVMDRELHEPLTIINVPNYLIPDPVRNPGMGGFVGHTINFMVEPREIGYRTPIVDAPPKLEAYHTSITLEPVMRTTGTSPTNYRSEIIFWYAYANDPVMALRLRAAFLPGQVGEMQMRQREAEARGILRGFGLALGMDDPDELF